ncbi:MAG TPA: GntR family transcriptional regulator [Microthrixaceae bacterium]|nr:GntR family transcriptional regulator [Microthrixaceae bacterium]
MQRTAPTTRSEWVQERLRGAILQGDLAPGQRLQANELALQWNVSATPLREAFQRLASDGLVSMSPQRGARVASPSIEEAVELYELRILLEPRSLRQSLEVSDDAHRSEIKAAFEAFRSASTVEDGIEAHSQFHAALLNRCPSTWLLRFTTQLSDASRLFQVASVRDRPGRRHPKSEHRALCEAAVRGDIDRCVTLQEEHLRRTLDLICSTM